MDLDSGEISICQKARTCPAVNCSKGYKEAASYYQENHVNAIPTGTGGIYIVGLYPSFKEIAEQENMSGKSGELFRSMLNRAIRYSREAKILEPQDNLEIFISNVIRCRPASSKKKDLALAAVRCSIHTANEFDTFKPRVILACGELAAMFFTGKVSGDNAGNITRNASQKYNTLRKQRGKYQKPHFTYHGVPVVLTWNPARVIREEDTGTRINLENQIYADLLEVIHVWKENQASKGRLSIIGGSSII